jgi:hypothetical protein
MSMMKKLLLATLLLLPIAAQADNYYSFDGTNDRMTGTLTTTLNYPMSMAGWIRIADHPITNKGVFNIGANAGANQDYYAFWLGSGDNTFRCQVDTGGSTNQAIMTKAVDNTWAPFVCVMTSSTLRDGYFSDQTAQSVTSNTATNVANDIQIGESLASTLDFTGHLAYLAVWDVALSTADKNSLLAGSCASSIDASNLIGYWPLQASNATQANEGVDATGDLSVTGATFVSTGGPGLSCSGVAVTFTSGPTEAPATNGFTITGTLTGSGFGALVAYAVGVSPGDGAPTCTQIKAGQNDGGTAALMADSETWTTAVGDNFPLDGTNPIARLDVHVCGSDGTNNTSVTSFTDQDRSPLAGYEIVCPTSIGATSEPFVTAANFNPDFVAGDCVEYSIASNETADCELDIDLTALAVIAPGSGDPSTSCDGKRTFDINGYEDTSSATTGLFTDPPDANFTTPGLLCNGNSVPQLAQERSQFLLFKDEVMDTVDLSGEVLDGDGDPLTAAVTVGVLPTGTSMDSAGVWGDGDTPTVEDETGEDLTVEFTDECGDSVSLEFVAYVTDDAINTPDCVTGGVTAAECVALLDTLRPWNIPEQQLSATFSYSPSVASGDIISQTPAAAASMTALESLQVVVSLGVQPEGGRSKGRLGVGAGIP